MIYVFDTSSFSEFGHYYPQSFPTIWKYLDDYVAIGSIISVREVYNELERWNAETFVKDWAVRNKHIFRKPSGDEADFIQEIFRIPHFQQLVSVKATLKATPVADPFLIALAKVNEGCVVTQEKVVPNAARIPNVCKHFGVDCKSLEEFMACEKWSF